jgi:hypothetical protein
VAAAGAFNGTTVFAVIVQVPLAGTVAPVNRMCVVSLVVKTPLAQVVVGVPEIVKPAGIVSVNVVPV